jgi:hypothetical protein
VSVYINEDIKIDKSEYNGTTYVSIRKQYKDRETGELKPSKNGINMNLEAWAEFVERFDEIVEDMEMS